MTDPNTGMQVLIADDEPSIRFVLTEVLEGLGHRVVAVEDGDAALGELTRGSFDLAFLDIRMPGRTGIEVLQQCRASGCDVAIVIITAQNLLENAVESMKAGALDFIEKPYEAEFLMTAIDLAFSRLEEGNEAATRPGRLCPVARRPLAGPTNPASFFHFVLS